MKSDRLSHSARLLGDVDPISIGQCIDEWVASLDKESKKRLSEAKEGGEGVKD